MALGESRMYCVDCARPVLAVNAGLLNVPHCPFCGRRFTTKDNLTNAARVSGWKQGNAVRRPVPAVATPEPEPQVFRWTNQFNDEGPERIWRMVKMYLADERVVAKDDEARTATVSFAYRYRVNIKVEPGSGLGAQLTFETEARHWVHVKSDCARLDAVLRRSIAEVNKRRG